MKYVWLTFLPITVVWQYKTRGIFIFGGEWLLIVLFFFNNVLRDMLYDLIKWAKGLRSIKKQL